MIDSKRIVIYLKEIENEIDYLMSVLEKKSDRDILLDPALMRSIKYSIIVIAEAIGGILQHILAKKYQVAISGLIDTIERSRHYNILPENVAYNLRNFIKVRNMLVHRYWIIDDHKFLADLREGTQDFVTFIQLIKEKIR